MKCPNCLENFHEEWQNERLMTDDFYYWVVRNCICPSCKKIIIELESQDRLYGEIKKRLVQPKTISRSPIPSEVDDKIVTSDYNDACLVLSDSPKASAALSRRCLQYILREKAGVKRSDLSNEIQQILDSGKLPSDIGENLDAIRNIGNFAAHPIKSTSSGEIIDVEPGEAEWNLEVLEQLIDFFYVRPAISKKKRDALNTKLTSFGKPPLK